MIAVGVTLGAAATADAIVLAAAVAAGDVFLMPHAAVASSLGEYTTLMAKVVRSKAAFSRDASASIRGGGGGAEGGVWSEPITGRNAYLAWRATPPRSRPCRCFGTRGSGGWTVCRYGVRVWGGE